MSLHDLSEINPHLGLWQRESYVSPLERDWERWVRKVEALIGHGLDGNQRADGYSLDVAYDVFINRETSVSYATEILCVQMELDAALGPCLEHPPRS